MNFFITLIITIIIEAIIYRLFIKNKFLNILFFSILINCFTNPLANLGMDYSSNLFLIELVVFIIEIPLIKLLLKRGLGESIAISFGANFVSFLLGSLIGLLI